MNITEVIDQDQANDFFHLLERTIEYMNLEQLHEAYLIANHRNAVAVSLDYKWRPFIGYTTGLNPLEKRTHLRGGCYVCDLIRWELKSRKDEIKGGRVFITSERAFRVYDNIGEVTLCRWIWLGDDPVIEARAMLQKAIAYRTE